MRKYRDHKKSMHLLKKEKKLREAQLEHLHDNNKFASLYKEGVID